MKKRVYLDYAATTYLDETVAQAMRLYWSKIFGNPSSLHKEGLDARIAIDTARVSIAKILGCYSDEVVFTNGGTESDNLAILGVARKNAHTGKHIVVSAIEHHAVLEAVEHLVKKEGFTATLVKPDKDGIIHASEIEKAITPATTLVSVMYANNEVGTIQPVSEIVRAVRAKEKELHRKIYFHTDACQAAGYLDIKVQPLGVDLLTLNGGKLYGPKATGVLFIKKGTPIEPLMYGGGQEMGLRVGTENVPGIVGLSAALAIAEETKARESKRVSALRDHIIKGILKEIPKSFLNGHAEKRLPNNVNVSILDIEGEALILKLDNEGIAVSTGSACSSRNLEPSHVLRAMGLPYEAAHGSLRITLGRSSTKQDADYLLRVLPKIVKDLRELSPLKMRINMFKK
jgi:cysteine desulfurase